MRMMTPAEQHDRHKRVSNQLICALGYLELGNSEEAQKRVLAALDVVTELRKALLKEHPDVWKEEFPKLWKSSEGQDENKN